MRLFASSEITYFEAHGLEFSRSCASNGNKCVICVFPNESISQEENLQRFEAKRKEIGDLEGVDILWGNSLKSQLQVHDDRAYYASYRFLILPHIIERYSEGIVTLDIDSVVNKKIPDIVEDIGVYLRLNNTTGANPYEVQGMKVAAGILYTSPIAVGFAKEVSERIAANPVIWFNDQHAIYNAFLNNQSLTIKDFSQDNWLDWNFDNDEPYIFTGKGNRKFDEKYLKIKERYRI